MRKCVCVRLQQHRQNGITVGLWSRAELLAVERSGARTRKRTCDENNNRKSSPTDRTVVSHVRAYMYIYPVYKCTYKYLRNACDVCYLASFSPPFPRPLHSSHRCQQLSLHSINVCLCMWTPLPSLRSYADDCSAYARCSACVARARAPVFLRRPRSPTVHHQCGTRARARDITARRRAVMVRRPSPCADETTKRRRRRRIYKVPPSSCPARDATGKHGRDLHKGKIKFKCFYKRLQLQLQLWRRSSLRSELFRNISLEISCKR